MFALLYFKSDKKFDLVPLSRTDIKEANFDAIRSSEKYFTYVMYNDVPAKGVVIQIGEKDDLKKTENEVTFLKSKNMRTSDILQHPGVPRFSGCSRARFRPHEVC